MDTKLSNKHHKILAKLQTRIGRKKSNLFICEGLKVCQEIIDFQKERINFCIASNSFVHKSQPILKNVSYPIFNIDDSIFKKYSSQKNSQGIILVVEKPKTTPFIPSGKLTLVLDRLQDPGNVGTILRTAIAVGITNIFYTNGCVDIWSPKTIQATMGAHFKCMFHKINNLEELKDIAKTHNKKIWISTPKGGISFQDPYCTYNNNFLVLGNEGQGANFIDDALFVSIPMQNMESLNVAQAATLLLYN